MSKKLYEENDIQNIANAIRDKNASTDTYKISEMATAIETLPSGGIYQDKTLTITENGSQTIEPDEGYDAIEKIDITTNVSAEFDWSDYVNNTSYDWTNQSSVAMSGFCRAIKKLPECDVCFISATPYNVFANMVSLTDISAIANLKLKTISSANVIQIYAWFTGCSNLEDISPLANWDVSNIVYLNSTFLGCSKLKDLSPLANWNTKNVMQCSSTFSNCSSIEDISPLANWDMSNVKTIGAMFYFCTKLSNIKGLENWNTSSLTSTTKSFYYCSKITDFSPMANWNMQKVSSTLEMFCQCYGMTNITLNWNMDAVTEMKSMFYICNKLESVEFTGTINTGKSCTLNGMFNGCSSLKTVYISAITGKITNVGTLFTGCSALELVDMRNMVCSSITSSSYYSGALNSYVPTTVKIIVKDDTEKAWWQEKFANWSSCFYTPEEAIAEGIVTE